MSNIKVLKNNKLDSMLEEISLLKSAIIGFIGIDKDGKYNQKFVDELMQASKDKKLFKFTNKKDFLEKLKK